jgi:hypothetical protein
MDFFREVAAVEIYAEREHKKKLQGGREKVRWLVELSLRSFPLFAGAIRK